jgi:nickel superoxide dismutase
MTKRIAEIITLFAKIFPAKTAYAHCDIPCGIYDPTAAQIAAHTVIRMTQLLGEKDTMHDVSRIVHVKEEHGALVEKELGTLENDYFKPEHHKEFPELAELISEAVKLSAKTRQAIDMESAKKMLDDVLKISEIFYKSKKLEPVRISSGFPTEGELVTHK